MIVCANNKTVQCGSAWSFDTPTATASCGGTNVTLTILSTGTNGTCPKQATRTWQATDLCAYSVQCSQTVTMVDTTPPVLSAVPPGTTVACLSEVGAVPTVTASDNCDGANLTVQRTTSTNGLFPRLYTRTWTVTDTCGNTATASQAFTIPGTILPSATLGLPYNTTLTFACAVASPYSAGLASGTLPPGLSFLNGTGHIIGTPTVAGIYRFTAWVSNSVIQSLDYEITVNADCLLSIFSPSLCWKGEGTPDDTTGLHPGFWLGTPAYEGGKVGSAFRFNGTNYVHVPDSDLLSPGAVGGAMTIEGWIYPVPWYGTIVSKGSGPALEYSLALNLTNGHVEFTVGLMDSVPPATQPYIVSGGVAPSNQWHHIAGVFQSGSSISVYLDGVRVGTASLPPLPMLNTGAQLLIGHPTGTGQIFSGRIDELSLYAAALDDATIQRIYLAGAVGKCPPATCVPPPIDLVAWWPGQSNATDIISGHDGTLRNGTGFADGEVGQSFLLDGVSQYVHVPSSSAISFAPTAPMSVALWAYRTGSGNLMHLVGKRAGCGSTSTEVNYQLTLNLNSGEGLTFGAASGNAAASGLDLPMNVWTHLAGTFDGATFRLYINGELKAASAGTLGPENYAPLLIGGSGSCATFGGRIDEVSLYRRALTAAEVQLQYAAASHGLCPPTCTPLPAGVLAWWRGEGNAEDVTGLYPGTLHSATFTSGKVGQGFYMLGNKWVSFGTNVGNFGSNDFTVEFWMRTTNLYEGVLGKRVECQHGSFWDVRMTNGFPVVELDDNGVNYVHLTASHSVEDDLFHHIALVRQSTTVALYVDGILDASTTAPVAFLSNASPFEIGRTPCAGVGEGTFFGTLDEVTLYSRALSAAEIQSIHASRSVGKCPSCIPLPSGLLAWWRGEGNAQDAIGLYPGLLNGATFAVREVGQGFRLAGTNDSVILGTNAGNFGSSDFTVEFWMQTTGFNQPVMGKHRPCGAGNYWDLKVFEGYLVAELATNDTAYVQVGSSGVISDGRFHHVALVRQSTTLKCYRDGVLESSTIAPVVFIANDGPLELGLGYTPCLGFPDNTFAGILDEVALYTRALSDSEIQAIHASGNLGKCPQTPCSLLSDLVAWWPGEGNANELIGHHDGAIGSGVSFIPGAVGTAFNFNGTSGQVTLPNFTGLEFSHSDSFTVEAWVKPTGPAPVANDYMAAVSLVYHCSAEAIQLAVNTNGQAAFVIRDYNQSGSDAWNSVTAISPGAIMDGQWHHVAGVRDAVNHTVDLFVDGARTASRPDITTGTFTSTAPQHTREWWRWPAPSRNFGRAVWTR